MFFSSNRNRQRCCYDVFRSRLANDGSWTEPVNIGYPEKEKEDNILYATTDNNKGVLTVPIQNNVDDNMDTYLATFVDEHGSPMTILKGRVEDASGKIPQHVKITIADNETGEITGVYNVNDKTGTYSLAIPPGRNNNITYEADGYLFQSENINVSSTTNFYENHVIIVMPPVKPGSKIMLNNIFFDLDRTTLRPVSNLELSRIALLLAGNKKMSIELSYSMVAKENSKYDAKLAQDRVKSVEDYFRRKGIDEQRVIARGVSGLKGSNLKPGKQKGSKDKNVNLQEERLTDRLELKVVSVK